MEQNKKELLLGQIDKINEVISTLSENFPLPRFLTKGNLDYFSFLTKFIVMLIFLFTFIALPQVKVPSSIPVPPF